jgi:hypothetical protein
VNVWNLSVVKNYCLTRFIGRAAVLALLIGQKTGAHYEKGNPKKRQARVRV